MLTKVPMRAGWLLAGAFLLQGGFQALAAQETAVKIAVVDLDRVFVLSEPGKALQAKLEKFQKDVQAEGERLNEAANDVRKRASEGGQSLSEEKLAELQKEHEDKQIAIRRFRDDKQREGEKMKNEGLRQIEVQLEPVFKSLREERDYDIILNNVPGIVVMSTQKVDITDEIVKRLNESVGAAGSGGG